MRTQPLSNRVLLACANRRARQANIGIAKQTAKAFDNYWAKESCLKDLLQTNRQKLSTLCIYLKVLLNTIKNVPINKTLSLTTLAHDFYAGRRLKYSISPLPRLPMCRGMAAHHTCDSIGFGEMMLQINCNDL